MLCDAWAQISSLTASPAAPFGFPRASQIFSARIRLSSSESGGGVVSSSAEGAAWPAFAGFGGAVARVGPSVDGVSLLRYHAIAPASTSRPAIAQPALRDGRFGDIGAWGT